MRITSIMKTANNQNLEVLKKVINQAIAEAPQYLEKLKTEQRKIVYDKLEHLNKWYMKVIGLDEVKIYQERVTALQDQLLTTQTKRRDINRQLSEIRRQAQDVQSQIQHIDRKEKFDVYCQLINDEREILNLERSVAATFQEYDQAERDLFTAFTNSVRDSQEKQRAQLEYAKYLGLILSIIGSFLAFLYTFFWRQDLKAYIDKQISSLKADNLGNNISEAVEIHLKELKHLQINNYDEILRSREDLRNVMDYLNTKENTTVLPLPMNEFSEKSITILKYMGIGFLGYVICKSLIG